MKSKILGIDFGSKRVGLAISDETRKLAFPVSVIENNEELLEKILEICKKENVDTIVMGESIDFAGKPNLIMEKIDVFVNELEQKNFKVIMEPEFMTSQQAEYFQGKNDNTDAAAAAIILQSFLDRRIEF